MEREDLITYAKQLINEKLDGKHTIKQLEKLLTRVGITLTSWQNGRGSIKVIITIANIRETFTF